MYTTAQMFLRIGSGGREELAPPLFGKFIAVQPRFARAQRSLESLLIFARMRDSGQYLYVQGDTWAFYLTDEL